MNRRKVKVIVIAGTIEEFFKRAHEDAKKMDRGEILPPEVRVTFEDPIEMLRALSAERMRVIRTVQKYHAANPTVSKLAVMLKRDRKAVSRDVKMKVVEPLAEKYHLMATI